MAPHTFRNLAHIHSSNMGLPLGLTSSTTRHTVGIWFTLRCPCLRFVLLVEVVVLEGCGGETMTSSTTWLITLRCHRGDCVGDSTSCCRSNNRCICYLHIWSNDAYNKNITKTSLTSVEGSYSGSSSSRRRRCLGGVGWYSFGVKKTTRRVSIIVRWFFGLLHKGFICKPI
jgi:hypothetical protein